MRQAEINKFFKLHKVLVNFANRRKKVIKGNVAVSGAPLNKIIKLRDTVAKDPEMIDSFIKENPDSLSNEDLSIVKGWKRGIHGEFFVVKYGEEHTVFYHQKSRRCYGVLHLNDPFEEMLGPFLPVYVEAWLIPYLGKIIYDGLLVPYSVSFGGGMRRSVKAEYEEAIVRRGLITSFDQEDKVMDEEELLRFYMKSEANMERYMEEIERLSRKTSDLKMVFYQEKGRIESRDMKKRLRKAGVKNQWYGVLDGAVVATANTKQELTANITSKLPEEKRELVYTFKV